MKNITILIIFLFSTTSLIAQSYRTAVGLRLGTGIGISVQQKVAKFSTIEAILMPDLKSDETSIDLLFEQHKRIISKRFNLYLGGGVHKAWRNEEAEDFGNADAGVTGIFGGEFSFKRVNLSWDFKPTIDFLGGDGELSKSRNTAVTLRYIFVPQKKNENWKIWKKDTRDKRKEDKAKKEKKEAAKKRRQEAGWKIWKW